MGGGGPPIGIQPTMPPPAAVLTLTPANIRRQIEEPEPERSALVKQIIGKIKKAREKYDRDDFEEMRNAEKFISGDQWDSKSESKEKYTANLIQRHVAQKVSALYAKNPTAVCTRRKTMDFAFWDETRASLIQAQNALAPKPNPINPMGPPIPPNPNNPATQQALQVLQDFMAGFQERQMMSRIARTMETVFKWSIDNQQPPFKKQLKQAIRRTCTTKVAYVKLGYQRFMEPRPEDVNKVTDITQRLKNIERIMADIQDDELKKDYDADAERMRLEIQALQSKPDIIVREGLVFDFPKSTDIIIDPKCSDITSFSGAQWIAQQYILSRDEVEEIYDVDIGKDFKEYNPENKQTLDGTKQGEADIESRVCVWEFYEKKTGLLYVVADGVKDFLQEPGPPPIHIDRFWPWFSLAFNQVENEDGKIYPQSDVDLLIPMQKEYNRTRQNLREHRFANRPKYGVGIGSFEDEDIEKLKNPGICEVIILKGMQPGQKVAEIIQAIPSVPIDPKLYDVNIFFDDLEKVGGSQEANLGGGSGDTTATESAIAESSRMSSLQSNADELEDMLGELFGAAGQVLLLEMSAETVQNIAGKGAVWPVLRPQDIANQLTMDIRGGSAGRPNKAVEIANFDKIAPILLQIPGISPDFMAQQAIMRLDDTLDPTDLIISGMQSIIAQNSAPTPPPMVPQGGPGPGALPGGRPAPNTAHHQKPALPGALHSPPPLDVSTPPTQPGGIIGHPAGPRPAQIPGLTPQPS